MGGALWKMVIWAWFIIIAFVILVAAGLMTDFNVTLLFVVITSLFLIVGVYYARVYLDEYE